MSENNPAVIDTKEEAAVEIAKAAFDGKNFLKIGAWILLIFVGVALIIGVIGYFKIVDVNVDYSRTQKVEIK